MKVKANKDIVISAALLFGVLCGHSMMETARDTLFLTSIPASQLPWVYLVIAVVTLGVAGLNSRILVRFSRRRLLSSTLFIGAIVTGLFWTFTSGEYPIAYYALYVWAGVFTTVTVGQFWIAMADRFNVAEAKRAFGFLGAGGLTGATIGAAAAGFLVQFVGARGLVLVAAGILAATAFLPFFLCFEFEKPSTVRASKQVKRTKIDHRTYYKHPYLKLLLILVLLTTITLTIGDLVFKSQIVKEIDPDSLGAFFGILYAVINGVSLLVQLALTPWLLKKLGVSVTLTILPIFILIFAGGFAVTFSVIALVMLKGADGFLKHSLNRTATEILYLPLRSNLRAGARVFIDAVGARGGQAIAALLVLGLTFLGTPPPQMVYLLIPLALIWLFTVYRLKRHYLELFREQLKEGRIAVDIDIPELDLSSMEALVEALNHSDEKVVVNAIDLLHESGKSKMIPALILYHPSPSVVTKAFQIMIDSGRTDYLSIAERLLVSEDNRIRAAAFRAYGVNDPNERLLKIGLDDSSTRVQAAALIGMASNGFITPEQMNPEIERISGKSRWCKVEIAYAIGASSSDQFADILLNLSQTDDPEFWAEVARTMAKKPSPSYIPALIPMLGSRVSKQASREALWAIGPPALEALKNALKDKSIPEKTKHHIPRTISPFGSQEAVQILLDHLEVEQNRVVTFKILRGLGRMVADNANLVVDERKLRHFLDVEFRRIAYLTIRCSLLSKKGPTINNSDPEGLILLQDFLMEKIMNARERIFRLLGLFYRREDLSRVYRAYFGEDKTAKANSRELLENLLSPRIRELTFSLGDPMTEESRANKLRKLCKIRNESLEIHIQNMLNDESSLMGLLTAHYVGMEYPSGVGNE